MTVKVLIWHPNLSCRFDWNGAVTAAFSLNNCDHCLPSKKFNSKIILSWFSNYMSKKLFATSKWLWTYLWLGLEHGQKSDRWHTTNFFILQYALLFKGETGYEVWKKLTLKMMYIDLTERSRYKFKAFCYSTLKLSERQSPQRVNKALLFWNILLPIKRNRRAFVGLIIQ